MRRSFAVASARALGLAVLLCPLLLLPEAAAPAARAEGQAVPLQPSAAQVVDLYNAARGGVGLAPLSVSPELTRAAQQIAEHMAATGCLGSTCDLDLQAQVNPPGEVVWRAVGAGYGAGYGSAEDFVGAALARGRDGAPIMELQEQFTEIGVGVAFGGPNRSSWVRVAGARLPETRLPATPPAGAAGLVTPDTGAMVARVVELVNAARAAEGLGPLAASAELSRAAQDYAVLMAGTGCFSHECPPVPRPNQRAQRAGYPASAGVGENIAAGQATADEVMRAWLESPGHRENILRPGYRELGVGLAYNERGLPFWTQSFGTRGR